MRAWKPLAVIAILLGLAGAWTLAGNGSASYEITRATVDSGPITMTVETLGTVEPLSTVMVGCETTGKIVEILADDDEPVRKDQIICRIDPELANADHEKSEAELNRTRSLVADAKVVLAEQQANLPQISAEALGHLHEAEARLAQAEFNWKRMDALYQEKKVATEVEWIGARTQYLAAKAAVEVARATYEHARNNQEYLVERARQALEQAMAAERLARAQFDTTKTRVERCVIRSPMDGIVLKRYMDVGTTVIAALQTPTLFLIAPSLDRMRVNAKVSESDIVHIEVGQKARFTVEGRQRTRFEGTILHKRNQPEIVQGVTTYTVILEVDNDARRTLLPGMTVNVEIDCVHRPAASRIANAALRFKPPLTLEERRTIVDTLAWPAEPRQADGGKADYCDQAVAWRFDEAAKHWEAVPLWVGITDNVFTEILAGAAPGDAFVRKFIDTSSSGFSFKEAIKLASPDNRSL